MDCPCRFVAEAIGLASTMEVAWDHCWKKRASAPRVLATVFVAGAIGLVSIMGVAWDHCWKKRAFVASVLPAVPRCGRMAACCLVQGHGEEIVAASATLDFVAGCCVVQANSEEIAAVSAVSGFVAACCVAQGHSEEIVAASATLDFVAACCMVQGHGEEIVVASATLDFVAASCVAQGHGEEIVAASVTPDFAAVFCQKLDFAAAFAIPECVHVYVTQVAVHFVASACHQATAAMPLHWLRLDRQSPSAQRHQSTHHRHHPASNEVRRKNQWPMARSPTKLRSGPPDTDRPSKSRKLTSKYGNLGLARGIRQHQC